jgi:putative membrane-bound dehydrogenase-like protein
MRLPICLAALLVLTPPVAAEDRPKPVFPTGKECAAKMTVPPGFEVKLFAAEPDVVNPIGIDFDSKGRAYVLECLQYPTKAPGQKGADRIRVYEDTDGDGVADKVTTFAEGLNLATGIAVGFGGVFVGEAPNLIFLEDTDGDGKADKRTVLLDGWGTQDTHEMLNSFLWGPDGWLYGCHGVFTHSRVGKPGTPDKDRVRLNAGIWRYHPQTQRFELFAEGTSNPWGYDYDENGSGFLTACVIPHLFHVIPGGRYVRQAGQNFNPYNFGEIRQICDHLHYFGEHSHAGNLDERRFAVGGGHAHSACLIYQGGAYPEKWNGRVFMNNIHGSRINTDILKRNGSTYVGSHGEDFLVANDPNCRVIQLRTGPDGSIYLIDWYDPQICHNTDAAIWDRSHGRIYKVVYKGAGKTSPKAEPVGDVSKRTSAELVELLKHRNSWWWRMALRVLQERGDKSVAPALKELVAKSADYRHSLRALWALNNIGAFDEGFGRETLAHQSPWIRAWAVRLLGQLDRNLEQETWNRLAGLAEKDSSPDVRLQLASSCQRWSALPRPKDRRPSCFGVSWHLLFRDGDANDPVIPFMAWLAFEPTVAVEALSPSSFDAIELLAGTGGTAKEEHPFIRDHIVPRMLRRLASTGETRDLNRAVMLARFVESPRACVATLDSLLEALRGRRTEPPEAWSATEQQLTKAFKDHPDVLRHVQQLGVHFGDQTAVAALERDAQDTRLDRAHRTQAIQGLALAHLSSSVRPLLTLALASETARELRTESLRALAAFGADEIPSALLAQWPKLPADLRKEIVLLLTGRKNWAAALVAAMQQGAVDRRELTENDVRRIVALKDNELSKRVEQVWGRLRAQTPKDLDAQLAKFRRQLAELPGDRKAGQAVFEKNCSVCHTLFGKGNAVGPDLTGANRRDPEYLLINILDPNRVVGREYYTAFVTDKSGRVHTGILAEDTPQRVVLKGENAKLTVLPRNEIDDFQLQEKSLMPEGLPNTMTEVQFRDLIAYLLEEPFLTHGWVAGPFKMALASPFPIETAADPLKAEGIKWKPFALGPTGEIDMEKLGVQAPPTDSTAFVVVDVRSPRALTTALEVAAHEDVKVWLNGKEVHRRLHSDEPQKLPVELKAGVNRLLVKVHNIYGRSWLRLRLADPERVLGTIGPKP